MIWADVTKPTRRVPLTPIRKWGLRQCFTLGVHLQFACFQETDERLSSLTLCKSRRHGYVFKNKRLNLSLEGVKAPIAKPHLRSRHLRRHRFQSIATYLRTHNATACTTAHTTHTQRRGLNPLCHSKTFKTSCSSSPAKAG